MANPYLTQDCGGFVTLLTKQNDVDTKMLARIAL